MLSAGYVLSSGYVLSAAYVLRAGYMLYNYSSLDNIIQNLPFCARLATSSVFVVFRLVCVAVDPTTKTKIKKKLTFIFDSEKYRHI